MEKSPSIGKEIHEPTTEEDRKAGLYKWWILACVALGGFMTNLEKGFANIALPTLSTTFNVPIDMAQWIVSVYLLTICALLPIVGKLSDLFGQGRLLNLGFLIFAIASVFCAISFSFSMLLIAKVIQGIGASLVYANTMGIIVITFDAKLRGRAIGLAGVAVSLGLVSGPVLGGVLIEHFGWSSIFWLSVLIGTIGFIMGMLILPTERPEKPSAPFDYLGSILFAVGVVILIYTVSGIEKYGLGSVHSVTGLILAMIVFVFFYLQYQRTPHPALDLSLFKLRIYSAGNGAAFLSNVSLMCVSILMPFYLQDVMHFSPGTAGYVMSAYPLSMLLIVPLAGWLTDKIGPYYLTSGGLALNALGFFALTFLSPDIDLWVILALLIIFGFGHGLFQPSNNSSLMGAVPKDKVGFASGLNALIRNFGMVSGISLAVSLFTHRLRNMAGSPLPEDLSRISAEIYLSALDTVFYSAAIISIVAAAISLLRVKKEI